MKNPAFKKSFERGRLRRRIDNRVGVSLIEILIASIAGTVLLGALASLYLVTIQVYGVSTRVAEYLAFDGLVEDRLFQISAEGTNSSYQAVSSPVNGPDGTPVWSGLVYEIRTDHADRPFIASVSADASLRDFPQMSRASSDLRSGFIFWWKDVGFRQDGNFLESNIYDISLSANALTTEYAQASAQFTGLNRAQLNTFAMNANYRRACSILARNVRNFTVLVQGITRDLVWDVDYRIRE